MRHSAFSCACYGTNYRKLERPSSDAAAKVEARICADVVGPLVCSYAALHASSNRSVCAFLRVGILVGNGMGLWHRRGCHQRMSVRTRIPACILWIAAVRTRMEGRHVAWTSCHVAWTDPVMHHDVRCAEGANARACAPRPRAQRAHGRTGAHSVSAKPRPARAGRCVCSKMGTRASVFCFFFFFLRPGACTRRRPASRSTTAARAM